MAQAAVRPPPRIHGILVVDTDAAAVPGEHLSVQNHPVSAVSSCAAARRLIIEGAPAVVVTELVLPDGSGVELCRAVKALARPPTVLVLTSEKRLVPDAIDAGCDGVLLKPFAPNLLIARLGRLLRVRSDGLRLDEALRRSRRISGSVRIGYGATNEYWPGRTCPQCQHQGVISFDFTSHRQAWYVCLTCRHVWIDRTRD